MISSILSTKDTWGVAAAMFIVFAFFFGGMAEHSFGRLGLLTGGLVVALLDAGFFCAMKYSPKADYSNLSIMLTTIGATMALGGFMKGGIELGLVPCHKPTPSRTIMIVTSYWSIAALDIGLCAIAISMGTRIH